MSRLVRIARENVNGCVFLAGAAWCYVGLAGWSRSTANVVAGVLLMAIGAFPYVRRKRQP